MSLMAIKAKMEHQTGFMDVPSVRRKIGGDRVAGKERLGVLVSDYYADALRALHGFYFASVLTMAPRVIALG